MPTSAWFHALGGTPEALGAVVVPLELGLQLSHLFPDLVQVEGVHDTLGVALALGQPDVL